MALLDSHAWIEYFLGSEEGALVYKVMLKEKCYTLESNVAEIYSWALREEEDFNQLLGLIKAKSEILHIQLKDWLKAVELRRKARQKKKGFGLMDSLLLAKQEETGETIITGDSHFKGMKNVVFLG